MPSKVVIYNLIYMFSERVHSMLIVIISLTKDYDKIGIEICDITREYNVPIVQIRGAVNTLIQEGLIVSSEEGRLLLSEKVNKLTLCDIVFRYGDTEFNGIFIDAKTKLPLRLSMASRVIIQEQNKLYKMIQNKLQHINLLKWSEKAGRKIVHI
ncbi:MAG: hypothetical protein RR277_04130 [Rikenellaceae bacterium]